MACRRFRIINPHRRYYRGSLGERVPHKSEKSACISPSYSRSETTRYSQNKMGGNFCTRPKWFQFGGPEGVMSIIENLILRFFKVPVSWYDAFTASLPREA